jgi:hypothetical protein
MARSSSPDIPVSTWKDRVPPKTPRSPQLSTDFVAEVGDQKGEAAEVISSSRPLPPAID